MRETCDVNREITNHVSRIITTLQSLLGGTLTAGMCGGKGQQRHMSGALDRRRQAALMPCTCAGAPSRHDLATIRDIALQALDILVIGCANLIGAITAHLTPCNKLAASIRATRATRTTRTTRATPPKSIVRHVIVSSR